MEKTMERHYADPQNIMWPHKDREESVVLPRVFPKTSPAGPSGRPRAPLVWANMTTPRILNRNPVEYYIHFQFNSNQRTELLKSSRTGQGTFHRSAPIIALGTWTNVALHRCTYPRHLLDKLCAEEDSVTDEYIERMETLFKEHQFLKCEDGLHLREVQIMDPALKSYGPFDAFEKVQKCYNELLEMDSNLSSDVADLEKEHDDYAYKTRELLRERHWRSGFAPSPGNQEVDSPSPPPPSPSQLRLRAPVLDSEAGDASAEEEDESAPVSGGLADGVLPGSLRERGLSMNVKAHLLGQAVSTEIVPPPAPSLLPNNRLKADALHSVISRPAVESTGHANASSADGGSAAQSTGTNNRSSQSSHQRPASLIYASGIVRANSSERPASLFNGQVVDPAFNLSQNGGPSDVWRGSGYDGVGSMTNYGVSGNDGPAPADLGGDGRSAANAEDLIDYYLRQGEDYPPHVFHAMQHLHPVGDEQPFNPPPAANHGGQPSPWLGPTVDEDKVMLAAAFHSHGGVDPFLLTVAHYFADQFHSLRTELLSKLAVPVACPQHFQVPMADGVGNVPGAAPPRTDMNSAGWVQSRQVVFEGAKTNLGDLRILALQNVFKNRLPARTSSDCLEFERMLKKNENQANDVYYQWSQAEMDEMLGMHTEPSRITTAVRKWLVQVISPVALVEHNVRTDNARFRRPPVSQVTEADVRASCPPDQVELYVQHLKEIQEDFNRQKQAFDSKPEIPMLTKYQNLVISNVEGFVRKHCAVHNDCSACGEPKIRGTQKCGKNVWTKVTTILNDVKCTVAKDVKKKKKESANDPVSDEQQKTLDQIIAKLVAFKVMRQASVCAATSAAEPEEPRSSQNSSVSSTSSSSSAVTLPSPEHRKRKSVAPRGGLVAKRSRRPGQHAAKGKR